MRERSFRHWGARLAPTFDSIVVFDPASQGIKFTGPHVDPTGAERFIICQVFGEALRAKFGLENPWPIGSSPHGHFFDETRCEVAVIADCERMPRSLKP